MSVPPLSTASRRAALTLVLLATLAPAACSSGGGLRVERPYATIVVENDASMTVNIYAVRQGTRLRMGQVTALRSERFSVRRSMLTAGSTLQLMVDPIGSRSQYYSYSIPVQADDVLELQVSHMIR